MRRETLDVKTFYASIDSPIGTVFIASTSKGICAISLAVSEEIFLSEIKEYGIPERDDKRFGSVVNRRPGNALLF